MKNKILNEAVLYTFNKSKGFFNALTNLIDSFKKNEEILINIDLLDYSKDKASIVDEHYHNMLKNNICEDNQVNIYLFYNLLWVCVEDVFEYSSLLEKVELTLGDYISRIDVTDKPFVDSIFKSNFSDNLLEINIDGDDLFEFEEETFTGSFINKTFVYKDIITFKDIYIRYVKFQPLNLNVVLTLREPNIVQFSNYIDKEIHLKLVKSFSLYIYKTNKKLLYFRTGEQK